MLYEAMYSGAAYFRAMAEVACFIENDTYYRRSCGLTYVSPAFGDDRIMDIPCGCRGKIKKTSEYFTAIRLEELKDAYCGQWLTHRGNLIRYTFDHVKQSVIVLLDCERDYMPSKTMQCFTPLEILQYKTRHPESEWWRGRLY